MRTTILAVLLLICQTALSSVGWTNTDLNETEQLIEEALGLSEEERYGEASELLKKAVVLAEQRYGKAPILSNALLELGIAFERQGRFEDAVNAWNHGLAVDEALFGPLSNEVARDLNNVAGVYIKSSRPADAEPLYRRALAVRDAIDGSGHIHTAYPRVALARSLAAQYRFEEAIALYQQALAIQENPTPKTRNPRASFHTLRDLGDIYRAMGKFQEAEATYKRSIVAAENEFGPQYVGVASYLDSLAALYQAQERWKEAEELYSRALANREGAWGPWAREIPPNVAKLAESHFRQGRMDVAENLFGRFITLTETKLGKNHPEIKPFLLGHADLLRMANQPERAASLEERARPIPDLPKPRGR